MNKCMHLHIGPDNSKKAKEQTTKPATDAAPPPQRRQEGQGTDTKAGNRCSSSPQGRQEEETMVGEGAGFICVREGTAT